MSNTYNKDVSGNFYSFVIPAHNEEKYIKTMLTSIQAVNFPHDRFEAIVVENGSTDGTLAVVRSFEKAPIKVFSIPGRGVSRARNYGARQVSKKTNWIIFIDADSKILPDFLTELDAFLVQNKSKNYFGGTATLNPIEKYFTSWFWYWIINQTRKFTKYPWVMQILRADLFGTYSYDETMGYCEDIKMSKQISRDGKQFVMRSDNAETSTRRFEKVGWIRLLSHWLYVYILPENQKKKHEYNVVR